MAEELNFQQSQSNLYLDFRIFASCDALIPESKDFRKILDKPAQNVIHRKAVHSFCFLLQREIKITLLHPFWKMG